MRSDGLEPAVAPAGLVDSLANRCHRHLLGLGCRLGRVRTGATGAFPFLRPEGLEENGNARHTVQTIVIRTFISFHIDYSIGYSYFKTKS